MELSSGSVNNKTYLIVIAVVAALCCACLLMAGALGVVVYEGMGNAAETVAPVLTPSQDGGETDPPTAVPAITSSPVSEALSAADTLEALKAALVPENDPYDLSCRLRGLCNVPTTLTPPAAPLQVGAKQKIWAVNVDTNVHFQIDATLRYITAHAYFWAQDGLQYNEGEMRRLMETFENQIYPTDREFFGSEWTPGVDGDPHIYIVYTRGTGPSNAGYFAPSNQLNPLVHEYANGHEMYFFNADNVNLASEETYATLAHEFQHMIHSSLDRNETSWINEGFSMLAEFLNGYAVNFDRYYVMDPDLQLTDWGLIPGQNGPHYGQSFLFLAYYLDRFGEEATQALVKSPENDITSVDGALASLDITDPITGRPITADDIFVDWAAALFLHDGSVGDGRYAYHNYPAAPQPWPTETIYDCPTFSPLATTVHQYGIDYINVECIGDFTLRFEGATMTALLPEKAYSGDYAFWSNKGDESDMTLTREFDLTGVSGPVMLSYFMWYDLETDYDYLYLELSEDGERWTILETPSGRPESLDPSGNAYGWAYNGQSNGWIQEQVDLSAYAGKKIQIRFEYITDAAANAEGFLLDDVRVEAIGYSTDFETDDGGWVAAGFARVGATLPQIFRLALIIQRNGQSIVQNIAVNPDQTADIPLSLQPGDSATLIVTGVTRFTRGLANYSIAIR
jgi:hypothetical protein